MRLLMIHCDFMEYEAKKPAGPFAEELSDADRKGRVEDALAVFCAVEKGDDTGDGLDNLTGKVVDQVREWQEQVACSRVLLYPYAHLSPDLARPAVAVEALRMLEERLVSAGFEVKRSPFGWYKSFELSCKGHPLSESSKYIVPDGYHPPGAGSGAGAGAAAAPGAPGAPTAVPGKPTTREEAVKDIRSEYHLLFPDGRDIVFTPEEATGLEVLEEHPELKEFVLDDLGQGSRKKKQPPSIEAMQRLELIDYEPASDSGHFRFFPKGQLMFELLHSFADDVADKLDCMRIETPILYNWDEPDIRGQTQSFHERHYIVTTPDEHKEFVLRFAGDFGLFRMLSQATLSYRNLPFKVYEFSKSFRLEQRGELSGLRRLRAFHMPDIHAFARDLEEGWGQFNEIFGAYIDATKSTGVDFSLGFRVEEGFYEQNREHIQELLIYAGRPALIEVLSGMKHYWVIKCETVGLDAVGNSLQVGTVQLDVEDAERYGITYADADGTDKGCIICHASVGSIERWIYAILEGAYRKPKPEFPFWLAPTQLRLIPVSDEFVKDCQAIASHLQARVDVDDRDQKVGRKIRDAGKEWVSLVVVYGEKERESGKLPVRDRTGTIREMGLGTLRKEMEYGITGYPYRDQLMPELLSKRFPWRG